MFPPIIQITMNLDVDSCQIYPQARQSPKPGKLCLFISMVGGLMSQETPQGFIDVHAHIAPTSFLKEVQKSAKAFGVRVEETDAGHALTFPGLPTLRAAGGSLSDTVARSEWMKENGVGSQYMAAWLDIQGYTMAPDKEGDWVRLLNEHMAQTAIDAGSAFRAIAAVPMQDGNKAAKELEYAVNTLGMLGAMLPSDPADIDVGDGGMEPLWAAAEDLEVPVMLHGASHSKWPHVGPNYMAFSMGRTLDTTCLLYTSPSPRDATLSRMPAWA